MQQGVAVYEMVTVYYMDQERYTAKCELTCAHSGGKAEYILDLYVPHYVLEGLSHLSDEEKAEELHATDRKKYLEGTVAAKAAQIGWRIVPSGKENDLI